MDEDQVAYLYEQSNLTRLQLLYWTSQQLRDAAPIFNTILTFQIEGDLRPDHFRRAFQALVMHSDALRTVIEERDGIPQQRVLEQAPCELEILDLSSEPNPLDSFQFWLETRAHRPLNIDRCLFDSALVKLEDRQHAWFFNQHHIITDASSFFLTYQRMAEFYERSISGKALELPNAPLFKNYVAYERSYRISAQSLKAEAYWKRKLAPGPEPVHFFGLSPGHNKSDRVTRVSKDLGEARSRGLQALARQEGLFTVNDDLSLYNLFAAMFFALLHQISGNYRLGCVTPVHNRFTEEFRNTIGLLMELCPLQVEVSTEDTLLTLVKKVRRETRETMVYYQYGSGLQLHNPAFEVMFNMHRWPALRLNGSIIHAERIHPGLGSESLALHVNWQEVDDHFILHFDFQNEIFNERLRQQTLELYLQIVDHFLERDIHTTRIADLPDAAQDHSRYPGLVREGIVQTDSAVKPQKEFIAPRDDVEGQIAQAWENVLETGPISVNDNFFDLGGTSWLATKLFLEIQNLTGSNLPLSTLLHASTVEDMATIIRRRGEAALWSSLVALQADGNRIPIFCVPGAGGNLLRLADLAASLGTDQPFYAFQVPGLDGESEPFERVESMGEFFLSQLTAFRPEGPYVIAGYSWGGTVALELAQQLVRRGKEVPLLVILDMAAQSPHYRWIKLFADEWGSLFNLDQMQREDLFIAWRDRIFRLDYFLRRGAREGAARAWRRIQRATPRKVARKVSASLEIAGDTTPVRKQKDFWAQYHLDPLRLKIIRINERTLKLYIPQEYPGKVLLFISSKGEKNPAARSAAPQLGWKQIARGGVDSWVIPGGHLEIMEEPGIHTIAEQLRNRLDKLNGASQTDLKLGDEAIWYTQERYGAN